MGPTEDFMCCVLLAQWLYDAISLEMVFVPLVLVRTGFTEANLVALLKKYERATPASSAWLVSNPTGSAGAHSGFTCLVMLQLRF